MISIEDEYRLIIFDRTDYHISPINQDETFCGKSELILPIEVDFLDLSKVTCKKCISGFVASKLKRI